MLAAVMSFVGMFAVKTEIMQQCLFDEFYDTFCDTFAAKVEIMQ